MFRQFFNGVFFEDVEVNSIYLVISGNAMKYFTIIILAIVISINSYSNQSCGYIATKQGITIISLGSCYDSAEQQRRLNSYLDFVIENLNDKNKDLQVLILLGHFGVHRPQKDFISVAYDTLSKTDTVFIDDSELKAYKDIYHLAEGENWFLNYMFPSEIVDSIYNSKKVAGIKIRFYGEFDTTQNYYDKILSITQFAIRNSNQIKEQQAYIKMPYDQKGQKIAVLTFDTTKLNSIKAEHFGFQEDENITNNAKSYILIVIAGALFILVLSRLRKRI